MRLRQIWNFPALVTFYNLRMDEAFALDRAIVRFAETGQGTLEWDPPHHRLRTGAHDAIVRIDVEARELHILRIYRARR
jgi:hypothetical protein